MEESRKGKEEREDIRKGRKEESQKIQKVRGQRREEEG